MIVSLNKIYKLIKSKKKNLLNKKTNIHELRSKILKLGINKIEYLKILDINKIIKPYKKIKKYKIFIAYFIKSVRLIDNI